MQAYRPFINKLVLTIILTASIFISACSMPGPAMQGIVAGQPAAAPQASAVAVPNYDVLNREEYNRISENRFQSVLEHPKSTFSVDVDTASYSNIRRFINQGALPPVDAVRIEEMVNYFNYAYPSASGQLPFSVTTEIGRAPWNPQHRLVHIGLKARQVPEDQLPPANIVFLIDVSGSMYSRLPLVKASLKLLANRLRARDRISIVVYAGAAGLVLPATSGDNKQRIRDAIDHLVAGGSTAGGAGIRLAYKVAHDNFIQDGNNRIVLATDGDFNVGASSQQDLENLIEAQRNQGIFLTVLGFGMGNYRDSVMETLADKGNGNYDYIDSMQQAKKSLVQEFGGTVFTVAKDVKLQVQFNPRYVAKYRLIGYENRLLNNEDFANDKKDAGDIGSGHTVTALYEVIPNTDKDGATPPRYITRQTDKHGNEMLYVQIRYKSPNAQHSELYEQAVNWKQHNSHSKRFAFSAAVAEFGMLLRNSQFKGKSSYTQVLQLAKAGKGRDPHGYRSEFITMVETAAAMSAAN